MGVNRSRRVRSFGYQRDKFSSARMSSAKQEAKTLFLLVKQDVDSLQNYVAADSAAAWASSDGAVTGFPDAVCFPLADDLTFGISTSKYKGNKINRICLLSQVLYEMGILYDTPAVKEVLPVAKIVPSVDQEADWDIVSEVSEWDVVSLDDGFSDDDSWG